MARKSKVLITVDCKREPNFILVREAKGVIEDFSDISVPIMRLLRRKRTNEVFKELCSLFYPVWNYYINFYLYKYRVYDTHYNKDEFYNDIYCNCIDLLKKVEHQGNDFNRIKRYFNKSIGGWIFNKLFKTPKKKLDVSEDGYDNIQYMDPNFRMAEYTIDKERLEAHAEKEVAIYFELYGTLFGEFAEKRRAIYKKNFMRAMYTAYIKEGKFLSADDFFSNRFKNIFVNENQKA